MNQLSTETVEYDPFAQAAVERVCATSEAQREVWLADRLSDQASLAFNESVELRLRGELDAIALRAALRNLLRRHEALRATVGPEGTELLIAARSSADAAEIPTFDLRHLGEVERREALARAVVSAVETPFNLERGPLLRAAIYRNEDREHVLLMTAHHVICDGWSWGVIVEDLGSLYAEQLGLAPGPDDPQRYSDYVDWETHLSAGPEMAEHERFWVDLYSGNSLPALDLPTDRPRGKVRTFSSRRVDVTLGADLVAQVRQLGARFGSSAFSTFFTGFAALMHRLTGQDDIVVGVPSAGQAASGMTSLVGHCVNLLPVRTGFASDATFITLLRDCSSSLLGAYEHQAMTYGSLLKKLPIHRDPSRLPLVSVMFNIDQAVKSRFDGFPALDVELRSNPRHCENFELFVNAAQLDGGLRLECQYNTDLFDEQTVRRWLDSYAVLLRAAVAAPEQPFARLGWLTEGDDAMLRGFQPTRTWFPRTDLMHSSLERQAAKEPDRVALSFGEIRQTYAELDQRANQVARILRARGVRRGARVGLCMSRGPGMVAALLGVLKAGAAYVPLDPNFPQSRLNYYAEDAKLAVLLTESSVTTGPRSWCADAATRVVLLDDVSLWTKTPTAPIDADADSAQPEDVAYVIYTSGSTGKPKGVCVPHRAVVNFIESMRHEPGLNRDDRLAAVTTLSFDIAVLELLVPLSVGAQVEIVSRETAMDGNLLSALLRRINATCMQATPGMWRLLLDAGWQGGVDFKALVGGEALPPDLAEALLDRTGELWNMYGPTETTVWSTVWHVERSALGCGVSIGRPIANTTVWILDEHRQPCPVGVPGEICIGGDGVTLGYLDRDELTAERFIADPRSERPDARLYRTGDRGRWRNDGLLEHLGRLDFQVKVRGYRIELGEIETVCVEHPTVGQCVVMAREDVPGDVRLVAYCVAQAGAAIDEAALRKHLRDKLPEYMIPQHVVALAAVPLLPNGKIDRKSLPMPESSVVDSKRERILPGNELERKVVSAMESVLNLPGLSIDDDFFAMGGHSLLAARLTSRLNRDLGISLPLRTLFEAPTAAGLAAAVETTLSQNRPKREPIRHLPGRRTAPLTVMQERILFVMQMYPDRTMYNTPSAHRLLGAMDVSAFERALAEMVRRQPALRTHIAKNPEGDRYVQIIDEHAEVALGHVDLSHIADPAEREAELARRSQEIFDTPMDIARAPLVRACLYRLGQEEHALVFMPHHLFWDGWSFDLLYDEMATLYGAYVEGREPGMPPLEVTYGDYAEWHADWLQGPEAAAQIAYWKDRFQRAPASKIPTPDKPRRAGLTGIGAVEGMTLDRANTEQLRTLAVDAGATLNMLTMALFAVMMAQAIGDENLVIGVPMRGRQSLELEPIIGFFNNTLVAHVHLNLDRPVTSLVREIKADLLELFEHQEVPFERLVVEPEIAARAQGTGLFQILFSFQDARDRNRQWGNLRQQSIRVFPKDATQDLGMWLRDQPDGLYGAFVVNADLYDADTGPTLHARYLELVQRFIAAPGQSVAELMATGDPATAKRLSRLGRAPAPVIEAASASKAVSLARSSTEQVLAEVWSELLGLVEADVSSSDNFFDLGGNSLLAIQAVERVAARLGKRIQPRLYVYEALSQLAKAYDAEPAAAVRPKAETVAKAGLLGKLGGWLTRN